MKRPRAREEKGKDLGLKESPRGRAPHDRLLQGLHSLHRPRVRDPNPKPNLKHAHVPNFAADVKSIFNPLIWSLVFQTVTECTRTC